MRVQNSANLLLNVEGLILTQCNGGGLIPGLTMYA